ncbi:MAG: hypothetical protein K8Q92_01190 [Methylophilales bacterium]|nr:hypothetical protein [Methylophilales bacterium]
MSKFSFHKDMAMPDGKSALVYGSNKKGVHDVGWALIAATKFGARHGIAEGFIGTSYGIPVKGFNMEPLALEAIKPAVDKFIAFAASRPERQFHITRIGVTPAGLSDSQIAPLFRAAPSNCSFAEEWKSYL